MVEAARVDVLIQEARKRDDAIAAAAPSELADVGDPRDEPDWRPDNDASGTESPEERA